MRTTAWRRARLIAAFSDAAIRYWLTVFPFVEREARRWRGLASAIPDPALRTIALATASNERTNLDGAAAVATFAPRPRRGAVARAAVAFQAAYDYLDSLAERPGADARALHEALHSAISPHLPCADRYAELACADDGGYLLALLDSCRSAIRSLPSHDSVVPVTARAVARMVDYQALIHRPAQPSGALAEWAETVQPPEVRLSWWETAAAGASSTLVFALLAAAARPSLTTEQAAAIERAYFPWVGALHVLLDSLVDMPEDAREGHHSLIAHYGSAEATADGLGRIAEQAFAAVDTLPDAIHHRLVLAAMVALYLSAPAARTPFATPTRERLLAVTGDLAAPTLLVLRARRATMALSRRRARDR